MVGKISFQFEFPDLNLKISNQFILSIVSPDRAKITHAWNRGLTFVFTARI